MTILRVKLELRHERVNRDTKVSFVEQRAKRYADLFDPAVTDVDIRNGHRASSVFVTMEVNGRFTFGHIDSACRRVVREMNRADYAPDVREVKPSRWMEVLEK